MASTRTPTKASVRSGQQGLSREDLLGMYEAMLLARALDERMWILQRQGKAAFVVSCQGHEACQVGSAWALQRGQDVVLPYYRDLGVVLVMGMTPREVLLGLLARAEDPSSGGRQMPAHWGSRRLNIITGSSPVATQIPHAAGVALAMKYRREAGVAVAYFGDGATSKGDFHEGLNFAGIHRLPVIFVCENNGYAISVPRHKQMAIDHVADRAKGYGFPGVAVDGNDVLAVYRAMKEAVERARRGDGPTLIEAKTYRFTPHSSDDDDRTYRSREEVEAWRAKDPIVRFKTVLEEGGILTPELDQAIRARVAQQVDEATDAAERAPLPRPEDALRHVYGDGAPRVA
ncbi:MAG: thiamine pyrophosphate-dependent dehydrogenase E1 component subunit alpha [Chloroflexi bacterium]|nr:thiamine pyrophosphate-dependent dehydrogenase E1 component subunit alpha [Chloroflexota bacterium]